MIWFNVIIDVVIDEKKIMIKINFVNVLRSIKALFEKFYDYIEKMNAKFKTITRKIKKILKLSFIEDEIKDAIFNQIVKFALYFSIHYLTFWKSTSDSYVFKSTISTQRFIKFIKRSLIFIIRFVFLSFTTS